MKGRLNIYKKIVVILKIITAIGIHFIHILYVTSFCQAFTIHIWEDCW